MVAVVWAIVIALGCRSHFLIFLNREKLSVLRVLCNVLSVYSGSYTYTTVPCKLLCYTATMQHSFTSPAGRNRHSSVVTGKGKTRGCHITLLSLLRPFPFRDGVSEPTSSTGLCHYVRMRGSDWSGQGRLLQNTNEYLTKVMLMMRLGGQTKLSG